MTQRRRNAREWKTIRTMIAIHCADMHGSSAGLCIECRELEAYAAKRLERCPYGETKPTCVNCPIHCYQQTMRERVRVVMRYAGPRMIWRHPWLAVMHVVDGRRKAPERPGRRGAAPASPA
ncbi:MAG: nitrous oxide-stimulated promoter family protein [Acidithiobacillales bacterium]